MAFFRSHSEETIYQRYGHWSQMTEAKAARLVGVDQSRDAALGVFEASGGEQRLIAIGRYCLEPNGRSAEMAFVVHEERRRLGLATILLRALIVIARERKLDRLVAQVQHDNAPMLALLRAAGARVETITGTGAVIATLALRDDGRRPPPANGTGGSHTTW